MVANGAQIILARNVPGCVNSANIIQVETQLSIALNTRSYMGIGFIKLETRFLVSTLAFLGKTQ